MGKVALCFSGLTGGEGGKDGAGKSLDLIEPYKSVKSNILDVNDVDIFMHSWSLESKSDLVKLYSPKKYQFEKQITFHESNFRKHVTKSRFYGNMMSLNLKKQYEIENNFTYDWVIISRFDLIWFSKLILEDYNNEYFYASHWNDNGFKGLGPYDRQTSAGSGLLDFWFFSNSNNMNKFAEGCDLENINHFFNTAGGNNVISGHRVSEYIVNTYKMKLKHTKYRGFDHEMYRRCMKSEWRVA
tara:strand:- start:86 stop:811 length:726 start_codon:yes stop_codon:yes gene_type:complete